VQLAEARQRDQWLHTSSLLALLASIHRDPKKRRQPYSARDFDPFRPPAAKPPAMTTACDPFDLLKMAFCRN
jgi:hypothetical protein